MDLVGLVADRVAGPALLDDVRVAGGSQERRDQVLVGAHLVDDRARLDDAGPADDHRDAEAALPVGRLLAAERGRAAVRPGHHLGAVVGRVQDDRVVGDAELVELVEELPDVAVVLDHPVRVDAQAGDALRLGLQVGEDVHPGRVPPHEERLVVRVRPVDEVHRAGEELLVDRLHPLLGQRAGVLDALLADPSEPRVLGRVVLVGRPACGGRRAARTGPGSSGSASGSRVVRVLRLLLGVEVVEVAEELVEAVDRRQVLVAVADVVLAELAGRVAVLLEQVGDRRVLARSGLPWRPAGRPWSARSGSATGR